MQKPAVVRGVGVADSRQRSALQGQQRFSPLHSSKMILKEYWDNCQQRTRSVGSPFEKQPTTALSALLAERDKKTRSLTSSPFEQTSRDALRLPSGLIGNPFEHQATTNSPEDIKTRKSWNKVTKKNEARLVKSANEGCPAWLDGDRWYDDQEVRQQWEHDNSPRIFSHFLNADHHSKFPTSVAESSSECREHDEDRSAVETEVCKSAFDIQIEKPQVSVGKPKFCASFGF